VGNGEGLSPLPSRLEGLGSFVSSPRGAGAEPQPTESDLVLSGGARMALVAMLVANLAFVICHATFEAEPSPTWM